jgi:lysophospholipase L1-like esterase
VKKLLVLSVVLNLIFLACIIDLRLRTAAEQRKQRSVSQGLTPGFATRSSVFAATPVRPGIVIFAGDSLTANNTWQEFFKAPVLARGISGDTTLGMLARLGEITRHKPRKLFLMIGVNDLQGTDPVQDVFNRYQTILERVRADSPQTVIYIESVLPTDGRPGLPSGINDSISALDSQLSKLRLPNTHFVDLRPALIDKNGHLASVYTFDGIHVNGKGYAKWIEAIRPLLGS